MKNKWLVALVAVVAMLAIACTKPVAKYDVTFDVNGGTGTYAAQTVEEGKTVTEPADAPTLDKHSFLGWFNGDVEYDFTTPVTGDMTLTAKWQRQYELADFVGVWTGEEGMQGVTFATHTLAILPDGTGSFVSTMSGYDIPNTLNGFSIADNKLTMAHGDSKTATFDFDGTSLTVAGFNGGDAITMTRQTLDLATMIGEWAGEENYSGAKLAYELTVDAEDGCMASVDMYGYVTDLTVTVEDFAVTLEDASGAMKATLLWTGDGFVGVGVMGGVLTVGAKVEAEEFTLADVAGTWTGVETAWGSDFPYTITINADGTGSGSYGSDPYVTDIDIAKIEVVSGALVVTHKPYPDTEEELSFVFAEGKLTGKGIMGETLVLTKEVEATLAALAGTWTGMEEAFGAESAVTLVINADGTIEVTYFDTYASANAEIEGATATFENGVLTVSYDLYGYPTAVELTLSGETLTTDAGFSYGTLTLTKA